MNVPNLAIPRLPVMSWQAFGGEKRAALPCLLEQSGLRLTTSGRASILLAMELLGLKPGDKVLVPTYHCPTMIAPVVAVGAEPVFYPLDALGGARLDWLRQQPLPGVKAILAAHYFGLPQPMQALRAWCDQTGITLIEDCAHSLFGTSGSRPVGRWGDIAIGSLTKFLPVPEGGCLQVNGLPGVASQLGPVRLTDQLKAIVDIVHVAAGFKRLRGLNGLLLGAYSLRHWLRSATTPGEKPTFSQQESQTDGYTIDRALSHRGLTWASAWISRQAPRSRIVARRRKHFATLSTLLSGYAEFRPLLPALPDGAAPYVFPLWVSTPDPGYAGLRQIGFPVSRWDRLWPDMPQLADDSGPSWSHCVLQLACHQDLSDDEVHTIASTIVRVYAPGKPESPTQ